MRVLTIPVGLSRTQLPTILLITAIAWLATCIPTILGIGRKDFAW